MISEQTKASPFRRLPLPRKWRAHSPFDRTARRSHLRIRAIPFELRRRWRTIRFVPPARRRRRARAPASTASAGRLGSGRAGGSATAATRSSAANARKIVPLIQSPILSSECAWFSFSPIPSRFRNASLLRARAFLFIDRVFVVIEEGLDESAGCKRFGCVLMMDWCLRCCLLHKLLEWWPRLLILVVGTCIR